MANFSERLSEQLAVVACIDPDAYGTGAVSSDVIDMRYHRRVIFVIQVGELAAGASVDFKVQEGSTSSPSSDLSGKAITQILDGGSGTDGDKQAIVEVSAEELSAGCRYIKGVLTVGTDAADAGVLALADVSRYEPGNAFDLASVDEIVA